MTTKAVQLCFISRKGRYDLNIMKLIFKNVHANHPYKPLSRAQTGNYY